MKLRIRSFRRVNQNTQQWNNDKDRTVDRSSHGLFMTSTWTLILHHHVFPSTRQTSPTVQMSVCSSVGCKLIFLFSRNKQLNRLQTWSVLLLSVTCSQCCSVVIIWYFVVVVFYEDLNKQHPNMNLYISALLCMKIWAEAFRFPVVKAVTEIIHASHSQFIPKLSTALKRERINPLFIIHLFLSFKVNNIFNNTLPVCSSRVGITRS